MHRLNGGTQVDSGSEVRICPGPYQDLGLRVLRVLLVDFYCKVVEIYCGGVEKKVQKKYKKIIRFRNFFPNIPGGPR